MKNIVIIGGGAAGFFCAANLDPTTYKITILEQNTDVLQKVKISGGGRCNVTHGCFNPKDLVEFYPRGRKELLSVFTKFQPADTMDWFINRGVELKIENDNRIFPVSNSSLSVINCLKDTSEINNVNVSTQTTVLAINKINDQYLILTNKETFSADIVIYTTGSSPKSLKILQDLGHTIVNPVPSLFTFNIKDSLISDLPGTSFENVTISIPKLAAEEDGPLLITHWGLSGPSVLKLSAWEARSLFELNYSFDVVVNFISSSKLEAENTLKEFKNNNPKKQIGQSKIFPVTSRFWIKVLECAQISPEKQISQLRTQETNALLEILCEKKFKVHGKSTHKDEFVTAGGVDLKEVNFKNMSSKILSNFYIAGEVVNIDAITGGFNFQACWSEAWIISQYLNENT